MRFKNSPRANRPDGHASDVTCGHYFQLGAYTSPLRPREGAVNRKVKRWRCIHQSHVGGRAQGYISGRTQWDVSGRTQVTVNGRTQPDIIGRTISRMSVSVPSRLSVGVPR